MDQYWNQALSYLGKAVEVEDSSALDQCMDWAFKWCQILGIDITAIRHGYAYQVWTQPNDLTVAQFEFIPNTPNGIPQKGDIPIFDKNVTGVTGIAGHICVATGEGNSSWFKSLDQNWNNHQFVEELQHGYTGVLGWLRPRIFKQLEEDTVRKARDDNWNLYQQTLTQLTECQNKVVTPTEIPVTVTTTEGSTIVPVNTEGTTSANPSIVEEKPTVITQPLPNPTPTKPSFTLGQLIAWWIMKIKSIRFRKVR